MTEPRSTTGLITHIAVLAGLFACLFLSGCDKAARPPAPPPAAQQTPAPDPWELAILPDSTPDHQPQRQPEPDDWFVETTESSGIEFTYRNGREGRKFTLLESVGGGVALFDFDSDGSTDLFITGGGTIQGSPIEIKGRPSALYRNSDASHFIEVSSSATLNDWPDYTVGCSVCDYNCDGLPDLLVTGFPRFQLYENLGDGTFRETTAAAQLTGESLSTASVWGDFDQDGLPDLFVTGYVQFDLREDRNCGEDLRRIRDICGIWQYPAAPDHFFHNRGDGTFEDRTKSSGLRSDGKGLGAVAADFNRDGELDLYVGNDFTPNFLYIGDGHGKFTDQGLVSGTAFDANGNPQGSMGVDFGDYDGDGLGDLFVTNYQLEDNALYRNQGDALFTFATPQSGLQDLCRPYVGFGTGWVDWDSDGWLDLFIANGHVMYHTGQSPYAQPQFLFRNQDGKQFENVTTRAGPYHSVPHVARGAAVGDLNGDGAPDLVVVHQNSPVTVLQNRKPPTHWVSICLHGTQSDPFATGAEVTLQFAGRTLLRHARGGAGYLSHFDRRMLFPVDGGATTECTVRWLNGTREMFRDLKPNQTNHLIEGRGTAL